MANQASTKIQDVQPRGRAPRATYLLILLDANKQRPIIGRTKLEKLLFLVQKRLVEELKIGLATEGYRYRSLSFGPFSEDVFADLETLKTLGLAECEGYDEETQAYRITQKGIESVRRLKEKGAVSMLLIEEIEKIKKTYGQMSLPDLIRAVYEQYPQYTDKSIIRDRVLGSRAFY